MGFALTHAEQAALDHLERIGFQVGKDEEQAIFRRRKRAVLVHREPAGGPRFPIEAPRGQMRLVRGFKRRDQLLKLVEGQTGEIQELGWARLHIGESYTGHLWCLLSWEAEYTIIGINSIILNHLGGLTRVGPYAHRDDEVLATWRRGIAAVAACPNVYLKLGGIGMPRLGFDWHTRSTPIGSEELAQAMAPLMMYCIEQVGPARCLFQSNFPPDKGSFSHHVLFHALKPV